MRKIGLTGGIASGKSSVVSILVKRYGVPFIDADSTVRALTLPGKPLHQKIVERFGRCILAPDGKIDRTVLGEIIMKDTSARMDLNSLVHPLVMEEICSFFRAMAATGHSIAGAEAALIIEAGLTHSFDVIVLVVCSIETRVRRLIETRGFTTEKAALWISSQYPDELKKRSADLVIQNDGTLAELESEVQRLWPLIAGISK